MIVNVLSHRRAAPTAVDPSISLAPNPHLSPPTAPPLHLPLPLPILRDPVGVEEYRCPLSLILHPPAVGNSPAELLHAPKRHHEI